MMIRTDIVRGAILGSVCGAVCGAIYLWMVRRADHGGPGTDLVAKNELEELGNPEGRRIVPGGDKPELDTLNSTDGLTTMRTDYARIAKGSGYLGETRIEMEDLSEVSHTSERSEVERDADGEVLAESEVDIDPMPVPIDRDEPETISYHPPMPHPVRHDRLYEILESEYMDPSNLYEKMTASMFVEDDILAGFNDRLDRIDDEELLAIVMDTLKMGNAHASIFLRDDDARTDYEIVPILDATYDEAYDEWRDGLE